jgi:hypothetical protein
MIGSAEEFIKLRTSEIPEDYHRAARDSADLSVWMDILGRYPSFKKWVIHNKTIPLAILELLAQDVEAEVRWWVATKRKISHSIVELLSTDPDESVRHALMSNATLTKEQVKSIYVEDSWWLQTELAACLSRYS